MKKYLILVMMFTFLLSEDVILPYISPGLQLGVNNNFDIFISSQLTLGIYLINGPAIGATIGTRKFYTTEDKKWNSFVYNDYQIGSPGLGFGIGRVYYKKDVFLKYKAYIGYIALLTYDYIDFKKNKDHNMGIFGVLPLANYPMR